MALLGTVLCGIICSEKGRVDGRPRHLYVWRTSMTEKKSFVLYYDMFEQMKLLNAEQRGELLLAIFEYECTGEVNAELCPMSQLAFSFIRATLERDRAEYEKRCEKNAENGKKGGRPKTKGVLEEADEKMADIAEQFCPAEQPVFAEQPAVAEPTVTALPCLALEGEQRLIHKDLPARYISEKLERAKAYAAKNGSDVFDVLLKWWHTDRARHPWKSTRGAGGTDYASRSAQTYTDIQRPESRSDTDLELDDWFDRRVQALDRMAE